MLLLQKFLFAIRGMRIEEITKPLIFEHIARLSKLELVHTIQDCPELSLRLLVALIILLYLIPDAVFVRWDYHV